MPLDSRRVGWLGSWSTAMRTPPRPPSSPRSSWSRTETRPPTRKRPKDGPHAPSKESPAPWAEMLEVESPSLSDCQYFPSLKSFFLVPVRTSAMTEMWLAFLSLHLVKLKSLSDYFATLFVQGVGPRVEQSIQLGRDPPYFFDQVSSLICSQAYLSWWGLHCTSDTWYVFLIHSMPDIWSSGTWSTGL